MPEKSAKYVEYGASGNLIEREVSLNHTDRYKTLGRRDANGKVILGIHTNLFHQTRSKTRGAGNQGYGPGNPHGPGKDKWGRKLSPLELMRRDEKDRQRRMRLEGNKEVVRHGDSINRILSKMDGKNKRASSASSNSNGGSSSALARRRSTKTLGINSTGATKTEDSSSSSPKIREGRRHSASAQNKTDDTASSTNSTTSSTSTASSASSTSTNSYSPTSHSSVAAAAAALAATSPNNRLSPLQGQQQMIQAINNSMNGINSGGTQRLPIPNRRRASTDPRLQNLQRRFGLASEGGGSSEIYESTD